MTSGILHGFKGALVAALAVAVLASSELVQSQNAPQYGDATHLGVAGCYSSTCHGRVAPDAVTTGQQKEYAIWLQQDKHSLAYRVLESEESSRMARKLGLESATAADICLDCHADNVPVERRGPLFQISDGVGCESGHGGAESWIEVHIISETSEGHARNLAA